MLLIFVFDDSCVSSTPNTTRVRTRETWTSECVCARTFREGKRERERDEGQRERTKERDGVRARDNIVLERKAVEEGQREREKWESTRDNREPPRGPRVLKCRALLCISRKICSYVRANCAKGSAFLPSSLYLCLLLHSSFFTRLVPFSSSLSRPLSPSNLSVFLFSPSRRPLFNFRSLSHDASIVYLSLPLSFFVSSSFCTCSLREREREGIRVSTFRQFIFCTELVRSQSGFLWSRASGNAVATRTAILR